MASQIAEGYILLSAATLRGFGPADLSNLRLELEKQLREARALTPAQDDALALAARNRRISRLSSAVQIVTHQIAGK
jgi:hypothetical protein